MVLGTSQQWDGIPWCCARLLAFHKRISDRHSALSHLTEEVEMALLEAFLFSYRNPQPDSHTKRVVNAWNNNLTFLWVIQILLVLQ